MGNTSYSYSKLYRKKFQVHCNECGWTDEDKTKFVNIEEDIQGADVLTFECPTCGKVKKSRVYGR